MEFDTHIGIDYSGARTATSRLPGLQVYKAVDGGEPDAVTAPGADAACGWTRQAIAEWLVEDLRSGARAIVGIDHAFSFPQTYFAKYGLASWDALLDDVAKHWPTHHPGVMVHELLLEKLQPPGGPDELRLAETWTSSAKSVFRFGVPGAVAASTHAGIPWLRQIRAELGDAVHFWPFDGWQAPDGVSVVAEAYPSVFRNRYRRDERTGDEHDAYAVARWLSETDSRGLLSRYLDPPLTGDERSVAALEGWILGIT